MRVIVLGAGLLGVTSAYYLQHLGHEVTVIDRNDAPAARLLRGEGLPMPQQPLDIPPPPAAVQVPASRPAAWLRTLRRLAGRLLPRLGPRPRDASDDLAWLDAYSRETLQALIEDTGLPPARRTRTGTGQLDVYTSATAFARAAQRTARLRALGSDRLELSADEALRLEPALAHIRPQLAGAIYSALGDGGERDDPRDFVTGLVQLCRAAGVRFLLNHEVLELHEDQGRVAHVELRDPAGRTRELRAQAYVMALGHGSAALLARLGITPARGTARDDVVTLPVLNARCANRLVLRDRARSLRFARCTIGQRDYLRVSVPLRDGAGHHRPEQERFETILRRTAALLPGAVDLGAAHFQSGRRPTRPAMPLIGRSRLPNLFLNATQGPMHWVNACGSGKSIAWIATGLRPPLPFALIGQ